MNYVDLINSQNCNQVFSDDIKANEQFRELFDIFDLLVK